MASRFIDELPEKNLKNSFDEEVDDQDFEFNQDFEIEKVLEVGMDKIPKLSEKLLNC